MSYGFLYYQWKAQSQLYKCAMVAEQCYMTQLPQLTSEVGSVAEPMVSYEARWDEVWAVTESIAKEACDLASEQFAL